MKTIFVHGVSRRHWLRVCRGFVLPVITCCALATACGCIGCSRLSDIDGDSVLDVFDNCPASANTDQADTDGNGVGDACQGEGLASGEGIGYSTAEGVAEAKFDQRLRSVQIASPGQVATLVWPDDSSRVDIELVLNTIRTTSSTPVDFSDTVLLAALDAAEAEGTDVDVYRQYIADHPRQILQIVTGQQPPSSVNIQGQLNQQQQVIDPTVQTYLNKLSEAALICRATAYAVYRQFNQLPEEEMEGPRGAHLGSLQQSFTDLFLYFRRLADHQYLACVDTCTLECNVPCTPASYDFGVCCIREGDTPKCSAIDETTCMHGGGDWHGGLSCEDINCEVGACCIDIDDLNPEPPDFGLPPRCTDPVTYQMCDETADEQAGIIMRTKFHGGKTCNDIICEEVTSLMQPRTPVKLPTQ